MLLQGAGATGGTLPPPGFAPPAWEALAAGWDAAPSPASTTVTLGPAKVSLGHDDYEADDADPVKGAELENHDFGWDNEHPQRAVDVGEFRISWRPVSNGAFHTYWKEQGEAAGMDMPASWMEVDGEIQVSDSHCAHVYSAEPSVPRSARSMGRSR